MEEMVNRWLAVNDKAEREGNWRCLADFYTDDCIYGWDTPNPYAFSYIKPGYRGEYRTDEPSQPYVYISPIDQQLHLLGAEGGVWQINSSRRVELTRHGDQPYLNQWRTVIHDVPINSLYALPDHLLFQDADGIRLKKVSYEPAIDQFQPPHDHETWQAGRAALDRTPRDPRQLDQWVDEFIGPELILDDGEIEQLRVTEQGFRLNLWLPPATTATHNELTPLQHWRPGHYALVYDGRLDVQPWSPPQITIKGGQNGSMTTAARIYEANQLTLALSNTGFADANEVTVTASVGATPQITKEHVAVLGGGNTTVRLPWTPRQDGTITVTIQAYIDRDSVPAATYHEAVDVGSLNTAALQSPDQPFALLLMWPQSLLLLLTACITIGFIWKLTRPAPNW